MDDAVAVGVVERLGRLAGDPQRLIEGSCCSRRSRSRSDSPSMYGMVNQRRPAGLARIVDGEDVGVLEAGGEFDLPLEPLGADGAASSGMQHLERDGAVVLEVLGEVDGGHAPATELALERIPVRERGPKRRQGVRQGWPREGRFLLNVVEIVCSRDCAGSTGSAAQLGLWGEPTGTP